MSDSVATEEAEPAGLPGWVMTFADLMTLLMCFFVLMLSFSEMDVARFKQLAGSMQQAFGVQAEVEVKTIPKGTSMIAREFSPGRPEPTVLNTVRQFTVNSSMNSLDVGSKTQRDEARLRQLDEREARERLAEEQAEKLRQALRQEIEDGTLLIRREATEVIVQIMERDSFASGSAQLESDFLPTLQRIGTLLDPMIGAITVSGHTDNVPISTSQYRSNWDLSAARAATVVHQILASGIDAERIMVSGHADTQPRAPNDSPANRALNRRIDITLATNREKHGVWSDETESAENSAGGEAAAAAPAPD